MMQSSREEYEIVAGRFELSNVPSFGAHDVSVSIDDDEEMVGTGVWNSNVPARSQTACVRRKTMVSATCIGFVLVVLGLLISSTRNDRSTSRANDADTQGVPTTQIPTTVVSTVPSPQSYVCEGDRFNNNVKLETNHFICSANDRYRFGIDETGSLLFVDDVINQTATIFNGRTGDYFMLLQDATFTVSNSSGMVVWKEECTDNVSLHSECLHAGHGAVYDCPYLHLHNGGTLVLNYISSKWNAKSALHTYNLGQCNRESFFCV